MPGAVAVRVDEQRRWSLVAAALVERDVAAGCGACAAAVRTAAAERDVELGVAKMAGRLSSDVLDRPRRKRTGCHDVCVVSSQACDVYGCDRDDLARHSTAMQC